MVLLQPRLNLKVAQKQVLTPGLVQMVSVLALNKLELKEMINAEMVENPVLEELDETVPVLDEVRGTEDGDIAASELPKAERDPFEEIDFGSYFQDYLDPGYRTPESSEISERPSFENFLSKPSTLTDHLLWQLGSLNLTQEIRDAAELVIGNLNEDGYLTASEAELLAALSGGEIPGKETLTMNSQPLWLAALQDATDDTGNQNGLVAEAALDDVAQPIEVPAIAAAETTVPNAKQYPEELCLALTEAVRIVRGLDPAGIAARDLRECLLIQLESRGQEASFLMAAHGKQADASVAASKTTVEPADLAETTDVDILARRIISEFLPLLQKRDLRELSKFTGSQPARVQLAIDLIRSLEPRPGRRYNREDVRLIEPDVAFVKRDDEFVVLMNEEDMPTLRLNHGYRRMLTQDNTDRDVRDYVKERYRSAIQLMRNIEQRKNTILRTCEVIVRRQQEFMEAGVEALKPMMIKEVAEEIGVHPSTVSRAVSNKYVHTPQGVFELRFFFSEGVNGPEGAGTPLLLLKRKVKKMIEEENPRKPLTDDAITLVLQSQGINVTRRTVAKYREDMGIPSTHQRRMRG
ncbi:MAG TPA: RNA polymerase factor sigma-54 [Acidobacteriaceae bacterium]|jgi:RNA polymerase sigma-54 factor|nr:RNA polymerase factor sigma-54 [Acidobacteriaceae bacterium]